MIQFTIVNIGKKIGAEIKKELTEDEENILLLYLNTFTSNGERLTKDDVIQLFPDYVNTEKGLKWGPEKGPGCALNMTHLMQSLYKTVF